MSTQQQSIETVWYKVLMLLAPSAGKSTEIILSPEQKDQLGSDGIAAIAQRSRSVVLCSTFLAFIDIVSSFNNAQVEVKDDTMTDTVRITVFPPGSLNQERISEPSPGVDAADAGVKKSSKVSRPPNAFILYRQHQHPAMVAQNPGLHNNEICKSFLVCFSLFFIVLFSVL